MTLLLPLLASALAGPAPTDLDGDGKPEAISATVQGVQIGKAKLECGDGDSFICQIDVVDVNPGDKVKELVICDMAPRLERACELYTYAGDKLSQVAIKGWRWEELDALKISAPGNGFVMVETWERLYTRLDKFSLDAARTTMTLVPQPYQVVQREVKVQGALPLTYAPGGGANVANAKAGTSVTILLESMDKPENFLVRTSSGLVGWATLAALQAASEEVMLTYSAG